MEYSAIRYLPPKITGDTVHWTGEFTGAGGRSVSVYFDFNCPDAASFTPRIRPFLLAFLIPAMRIGHPLQLDQPLDQTTLDNLMEWQCAMACWLPDKLTVVPIRAPIEPEPPKLLTARGALTAFSGGVDSCFTAFRHTVAPNTGHYRRTKLSAGLMVHGFDIPEPQPEVFASAFQRSGKILHSLGLEGYRLRTNLRSLEAVFGCDWEYETHGIWLAATLACLEPWFERVLIPSSYPYPVLRLPWGSNPVTDILFSSAATPVWHDGAAGYKLNKVQAMAQHPGIQQNLRVCWEGERLDRNCGRCFKCMATQVCFWLSGVPRQGCFPEACEIADVARARVRTASNRALFRVMHIESRRQHAHELTQALGTALQKHSQQKVRRKLKQLCRSPREFFDQL